MLRNGLYNLVSGVFRAGLAFISIPILIRLMGLEEYGLWALVSSVLGMLLLAEAGLSTSTTVFVSQDLVQKNKKALSQTLTIILGAMLVLATFAALLLWGGASWFVTFFPKLDGVQKQTVVQALQVGAIGVWAQLLQLVLIGVEQAYERYGVMNLLKTLQWLFLTLGWFALAWSGGRTLALAQWQGLVMVLSLAAHLWFVYRLTQGNIFQLGFNRQRGVEIVRYSTTIWAGIFGGMLFTKSDRLVVGSLLGSSSLGIYSAIVDFTSAINFFSAQPIQPLLPLISHILANPASGNKTKLYKIIQQATVLNACIATFLGAVFLVFTPEILQILLNDFVNSANILAFRLLSIIVTVYALNAVGYFLLFSTKQVTEYLIIQLIGGFLSLVFIFLGAKNFELFGAILGNVGYIITILFPVFALGFLGFPRIIFIDWIRLLLFSFSFVLFAVMMSLNEVFIYFAFGFHFFICCVLFFSAYNYSLSDEA